MRPSTSRLPDRRVDFADGCDDVLNVGIGEVGIHDHAACPVQDVGRPGTGNVMLDVVGVELTAEDAKRLAHPACGGVILFSRNYDNPQQLAALVSSIRASSPTPLLISVDHEGGRGQGAAVP